MSATTKRSAPTGGSQPAKKGKFEKGAFKGKKPNPFNAGPHKGNKPNHFAKAGKQDWLKYPLNLFRKKIIDTPNLQATQMAKSFPTNSVNQRMNQSRMHRQPPPKKSTGTNSRRTRRN